MGGGAAAVWWAGGDGVVAIRRLVPCGLAAPPSPAEVEAGPAAPPSPGLSWACVLFGQLPEGARSGNGPECPRVLV